MINKNRTNWNVLPLIDIFPFYKLTNNSPPLKLVNRKTNNQKKKKQEKEKAKFWLTMCFC